MKALFLCFTLVTIVWCNNPRHRGQERASNYHNRWVAKILGGEEVAREIAKDLDYTYLGPIKNLEDIYEFRKEDHPHRSKRDAPEHTNNLLQYKDVEWAEQIFEKHRVKRDFIERYSDPMWIHQWYMQSAGVRSSDSFIDLGVLPVYTRNYTGKNVRVCVVDDGLEHTHPDLKRNYDPTISFDLNRNIPDPSPVYTGHNEHGTRCAGEIAMEAGNDYCGVGVAYDCRIGGVKILDGTLDDIIESLAFSFSKNKVDIYSASFGPSDDGKTLERPGRLALTALEEGARLGRNGKGSLYAWASGNGGRDNDNCNCDGYTNSIYTISTSSVTEHGNQPVYGEECPSTLSSTYSSGVEGERAIVTTDIHGQCTKYHSGTSAAAPLMAGVLALLLEANPDLTWRDVQHIVVRSSFPTPLLKNEGWCSNSRGFWYNPKFGFGLINAESAVNLAERWETVPEQVISKNAFDIEYGNITSELVYSFKTETDACPEDITENCISFLEHVILVVSISYPFRGALGISLTSPTGTKSKLLSSRYKDISDEGFHEWELMSVQTWGENPAGEWLVEIEDEMDGDHFREGIVHGLSLLLYGTSESPTSLSKRNREVSPKCYEAKREDNVSAGKSSIPSTIQHYLKTYSGK